MRHRWPKPKPKNWDKWMHCMTACLIVRDCGLPAPAVIGLGNAYEVGMMFWESWCVSAGTQQQVEWPDEEDVLANVIGASCGAALRSGLRPPSEPPPLLPPIGGPTVPGIADCAGCCQSVGKYTAPYPGTSPY